MSAQLTVVKANRRTAAAHRYAKLLEIKLVYEVKGHIGQFGVNCILLSKIKMVKLDLQT